MSAKIPVPELVGKDVIIELVRGEVVIVIRTRIHLSDIMTFLDEEGKKLAEKLLTSRRSVLDYVIRRVSSVSIPIDESGTRISIERDIAFVDLADDVSVRVKLPDELYRMVRDWPDITHSLGKKVEKSQYVAKLVEVTMECFREEFGKDPIVEVRTRISEDGSVNIGLTVEYMFSMIAKKILSKLSHEELLNVVAKHLHRILTDPDEEELVIGPLCCGYFINLQYLIMHEVRGRLAQIVEYVVKKIKNRLAAQ